MSPVAGRSAPAAYSADDLAGAQFLRAIAVPVLAAAALLAIWAALELRPLFADGFYYLLRILRDNDLLMPSPARRVVELIRQPPVLVAMALGVRDLVALGVVFGLFVQLAPLALVTASWVVLPRERKILFVFPLLHFCAGTLSTSAAPINEGPTAAAYFWLLFYAILFLRARAAGLAIIAVLAAGAVLLHEAIVFLAPILALAALWRARREDARVPRIAFALLAAGFVVVAGLHAYFILEPKYPANRESFLTQLFSFWWIDGPGGFNLPATVGLAGLAAIGGAALLQFGTGGPRRRKWAWILVAALALACGAVLVYTAWTGRMDAARAQFYARNHPLLLSLPLSLVAFYALVRPRALHPHLLRQSAAVCGILAAVSLAWSAYATYRWSLYVDMFRSALARGSGLIPREQVEAALPERERAIFRSMSWHWTAPVTSIMLAPAGRVEAIIANTPNWEGGWQPFEPRRPETLPRSRFWNLDPYLRALAAQKAAGEVR